MNYNNAYDICIQKLNLHMKKLIGRLFEPKAAADGDYYSDYEKKDFCTFRWTWLTSMITGLASIAYETQREEKYLIWLNDFKNQYREKVFQPYTQTMHDIGFLYLPYSVHLYYLTGDDEHRDVALKAADELCKRYNVKGGFIEAWDEMNIPVRECRTIIDSAMNIPLLFWAWKQTGHYFYHDIAVSHLDTIIKTLVRDDFSVAHAWIFDNKTGNPAKEANACGYDNGSHWARGTSWLVYGLAIAYDYTSNEFYLNIAQKVLYKYLDSLEDNPVPVWDFRLPKDKPAFAGFSNNEAQWDETLAENKKYNVDTSAAAIMSCACMLFDSLRADSRARQYAESALTKLCNDYLDKNTSIPGILKYSNGRNTYTAYGDYYFMNALAMKIYGTKGCWGRREND